jgi:hypothetical protein
VQIAKAHLTRELQVEFCGEHDLPSGDRGGQASHWMEVAMDLKPL